MTTLAAAVPLLDLGASPVRAGRVTTGREATNGAPCLGFAALAACALWAGLGSTLALLLA